MDKQWFIDRLKEPSTWKGISLFCAATGISIAPELIFQIGSIVTAMIGVIDIVRKEK